MKILIIICLLLTAACSSLNPISVAKDIIAPDKPGLSVDVEAQVGKNNESVDGIKGNIGSSDNNVKADNVSINQTFMIPWWAYFIGIFTGVLVMPIEFLKGLMTIRRPKIIKRKQ